MAWRKTSPELVLRARDQLVNGATIREAAQAVGISSSRMCRWFALGPPTAAPGVPRDVPLALSAMRHKQGIAADAPLTEADQLFALSLAAREVLRASREFIRLF